MAIVQKPLVGTTICDLDNSMAIEVTEAETHSNWGEFIITQFERDVFITLPMLKAAVKYIEDNQKKQKATKKAATVVAKSKKQKVAK